MPGPPRKPTELKAVQGFPGGKHKVNPRAPKAKPASTSNVRPPTWLGKDAKKHWRDVRQLLDDMGVLSTTDLGTLATYAEAMAEWIDCIKRIEDELDGDVIYTTKSRDGSIMHREHPLAKRKDTCHQKLLRLHQEMGMTPAARARVSVNPKDDGESDPADKFTGRAAA